MAWTNIPDVDVEAGGIPKGSTITAIRDNIIAIPNGETGAPSIQFAALGSIAAGTEVKLSKDSLSSREQNTFAQLVKTGIFQPGSVRLTLQQARGGVGGSSIVEVLKNGVSIQSWSTSSTSFVSRSLDISVVVGDAITVQHRHSDDNSNTSVVQLIRFQTTGGPIWPLFTIGIEDVSV